MEKRKRKEVTQSYGTTITWNTQRRKRERFIVYCRVGTVKLPYHREATATTASSSEREADDIVILLSFIWFPSDNTLFIAPNIRVPIVTLPSMYQVIMPHFETGNSYNSISQE